MSREINTPQLEEFRKIKNDFYLKFAHALSGCQVVEQQLKLYITEALELARECVGDKMPFKIKGKDYENRSLRHLIYMFEKLSDNEGLVRDLYSFNNERNFLSHQAITDCLDYEGGLNFPKSQEFQKRFEKIHSDATRLQKAIYEEESEILVQRWFEVIPEDA